MATAREVQETAGPCKGNQNLRVPSCIDSLKRENALGDGCLAAHRPGSCGGPACIRRRDNQLTRPAHLRRYEVS